MLKVLDVGLFKPLCGCVGSHAFNKFSRVIGSDAHGQPITLRGPLLRLRLF